MSRQKIARAAVLFLLPFLCLLSAAQESLTGSELQRGNGDVFIMTEQEFTVDGLSALRVQDDNGSVSIQGWDDARALVRAERRIKDKGGADDGKARELLERIKVEMVAEGGTLRLLGKTNDRALRGHSAQVVFTICVPRSIASTVEIGNGSVRAEHMAAGLSVGVGNGKIQVDDICGSLKLDTGNGAIHGQNLAGDASANTGNGSVELSFTKLTAAPDIHCATGIGKVAVRVPSGQSFRVDLGTGLGSVHCGYPLASTDKATKTHVTGTAGGGGGAVTLETGIGAVRLEQL